ncbi:MAG: nuclear transport factor 2 family protein [Lewinella sp.]|nr:nuclear transport factor 2 family protein [Lewinella sp.]
MTTQAVADRLVELCRQGQNEQAYLELFHPDAIAVEPEGAPNATTEGLAALLAKNAEFGQSLEAMHASTVSDPLVADNFFAVNMMLDATFKGMGRMKMEEIVLYQVQDGKIVKEQFYYTINMPG